MIIFPSNFCVYSILALIFVCMLQHIECKMSLMHYYQAQHTMKHILQNLKHDRLQYIDDEYQQKCSKSNTCCLCKQQFKNSSYLELHLSIHHFLEKLKPSDYMLIQIFDARIQPQFRFQTCIKYFDLVKNSHIYSKINQIDQSDQIKKQVKDNLNYNLIPQLTKSQMVDACTIIAYGTYHTPLWIIWIRGTFVFVFAIVFLVYYSNIFDQIKSHYFPKKKETRNPRFTKPPTAEEESDNQSN